MGIYLLYLFNFTYFNVIFSKILCYNNIQFFFLESGFLEFGFNIIIGAFVTFYVCYFINNVYIGTVLKIPIRVRNIFIRLILLDGHMEMDFF